MFELKSWLLVAPVLEAVLRGRPSTALLRSSLSRGGVSEPPGAPPPPAPGPVTPYCPSRPQPKHPSSLARGSWWPIGHLAGLPVACFALPLLPAVPFTTVTRSVSSSRRPIFSDSYLAARVSLCARSSLLPPAVPQPVTTDSLCQASRQDHVCEPQAMPPPASTEVTPGPASFNRRRLGPSHPVPLREDPRDDATSGNWAKWNCICVFQEHHEQAGKG